MWEFELAKIKAVGSMDEAMNKQHVPVQFKPLKVLLLSTYTQLARG